MHSTGDSTYVYYLHTHTHVQVHRPWKNSIIDCVRASGDRFRTLGTLSFWPRTYVRNLCTHGRVIRWPPPLWCICKGARVAPRLHFSRLWEEGENWSFSGATIADGELGRQAWYRLWKSTSGRFCLLFRLRWNFQRFFFHLDGTFLCILNDLLFNVWLLALLAF